MQCPFCKEHRQDKVIDSRATEGGTVIRRRRMCLACKKRFTTYERIEESPRLLIIKKDGTREPFEREKLLAGLRRACWKRPVPAATIESIVAEVEEGVFRKFDREVPSSYLGKAMAAGLRKHDKVAYLRYASMYHEFHLGDVIQEAQDILDEDRREVTGQQDLFHE
ncbi:MAG: transcriptional regulator NrdR [Planctomycetota bacterium]